MYSGLIQLAPQPPDVNLDGIEITILFVEAEHTAKNLFFRHDAPALQKQHFEQTELAPGQNQIALRPVRGVASQVHIQAAKHNSGAFCGVALGPSYKRPDPRFQLSQVEWFDQIIVRSDIKGCDAIINLHSGSEHQNRGGSAQFSLRIEQVYAVSVGQIDVQNDGVKLFHSQHIFSGCAGYGQIDGVAMPDETVDNGLCDIRRIFNEQESYFAVLPMRI